MKGCELGAGETLEGYDAADERLEDGGAEEGTVAVRVLVRIWFVLRSGNGEEVRWVRDDVVGCKRP